MQLWAYRVPNSLENLENEPFLSSNKRLGYDLMLIEARFALLSFNRCICCFRLNAAVVSLASPVLLRMFLTSIFIHVEINIKDGALYCDTLCDKGPVMKGQVGKAF